MLAATASCTIVHGVGFDTKLPNIDKVPPYAGTPEDTATVSLHGVYEARLSCVETAPLFRTAYCDINTFDSCGNRFGSQGNESEWHVSVWNAVSHRSSRLVSPIAHVGKGIARFYFTPVELGVYEVKVERRRQATRFPSLLSTLPMKQLVVVHNTVAPCSASVGSVHPQLQSVLWSENSFRNEASSFVPGRSDLPLPTSIVIDSSRLYTPADAIPELSVRRQTIQAEPLGGIGSIPAADTSARYCDVIQQG